MPYDFAAGSFHTQNLCSRLSLRKAQYEKTATLCFDPLWGLMGNVRCSPRLIGKLAVDFLLVIELFSLGAFVSSQFTRLTDRWMEGFMITNTALCTMPCGKINVN